MKKQFLYPLLTAILSCTLVIPPEMLLQVKVTHIHPEISMAGEKVLTIHFTESMDKASVEQAIAFFVSGDDYRERVYPRMLWLSDSAISLHFGAPLPDLDYELEVDRRAESIEGKDLSSSFRHRFLSLTEAPEIVLMEHHRLGSVDPLLTLPSVNSAIDQFSRFRIGFSRPLTGEEKRLFKEALFTVPHVPLSIEWSEDMHTCYGSWSENPDWKTHYTLAIPGVSDPLRIFTDGEGLRPVEWASLTINGTVQQQGGLFEPGGAKHEEVRLHFTHSGEGALDYYQLLGSVSFTLSGAGNYLLFHSAELIQSAPGLSELFFQVELYSSGSQGIAAISIGSGIEDSLGNRVRGLKKIELNIGTSP